tara:strand:- start:1202 stop:2362 length:1161 start_codon:yes stop_codon:yes gene_type:complete
MRNNFDLLNRLVAKRKTLLGIGPISLNVIDAAIEISNSKKIPLMLIASRRQIDSEEFNGGYVNNWTTREFSNYVKRKDKKNYIFLSRDHGGPWQNNREIEQKLKLDEAMSSAIRSFHEDINNDFGIIHIDTSVDINQNLSFKKSMNRIFEIYEDLCRFSIKNKKKIIFEIGTEEQNGSTNTFEELTNTLREMKEFCNKKKLPRVTFVVIQSGTKVMETKNIGSFESPIRIEKEIPVEIQLLKMIEICNNNKVYMKEHNADYLTNDSLSWHPKLGIHAANVAPEFGVIETKTLLKILKKNKMDDIYNEFIKISYNSKKWKKWMMKNTNAGYLDKAVICGHYVFSYKEVIKMKEEVIKFLKKKKINLNFELKKEIKNSIMRYIDNFRL